MRVIFEKSVAYGSVKAPPSKSMAHRLLICAALSKGVSKISNISLSEDIKATINCLNKLGANITVRGATATVKGIDFNVKITEKLFCNESGSTLRFLIPICTLFGQRITLSGTERLFERSLNVYEDLFDAQNIEFIKKENEVSVFGQLTAGKYSVRGDVSSQFISGLLFTLPLLENDSEIEIIGDLESNSYILMTIKALADFDIRISKVDEKTFLIKGNQVYRPRNITVEGDYSNSAFLEGFNLLDGNVLVEGLNKRSFQGDKVYKSFFELLEEECPTIDVTDCPDLAPVLMALGAAKNGVVLTGTHRLKIKESDRAQVMCGELSKFGVKTINEENKITVFKGKLKKPQIALNGHNDHRIVMSLALLCSLKGGEIIGCEAVNKSFPDFFDYIERLGIKIKRKQI